MEINKFFFKEPKPFTNKREFNWSAIKKVFGACIGLLVLILLVLPTPEQKKENFTERSDSQGNVKSVEADPTQDAWSQMQSVSHNSPVPTSPDMIGRENQYAGGSRNSRERSGSMIIVRSGLDSKTQLPPGSQLHLKLLSSLSVSNQSVPVVGIVTKDVMNESDVAIVQGSKVFGEVTFDEASEKAEFNLRSVALPDGKNRSITGVSIGQDGQPGIEGSVHSEAVKNTIGETLTRFIGAYAEGSMSHGILGQSQGGAENGIKNAIGETAKSRAEKMSEDMKKERKWIEVKAGTEFKSVLTQPFTFRDPGGTYGN